MRIPIKFIFKRFGRAFVNSQGSEFGYFWENTVSGQQLTLFRNGFPLIGKLDSLSFYEVLTDGSISLLKYHSKILRQMTAITGITHYKIDAAEMLYLYFKDRNEIHPLKRNREYICTLLDSKTALRFNNYPGANNCNLKSEKDLVLLFSSLTK
ncbi:MAG: hypothetical protein ACM3H8_01610 [Sphingobacteriales bacterium]